MSLQGEGAWSGWPCFFIRLAGCNLSCTYCDTAWAREGGRPVQLEALVGQWLGSNTRVVQVTGGEPLLQPASLALMERLCLHGGKVLLETNGSMPLSQVHAGVIKVVDVKTPGSGNVDSWLPENLRYLGPKDQVKFVLTGRDDYLWALDKVNATGMAFFTQIIFSPASPGLEPVELAEWMVRDRPMARMQIQLHKFLWGGRRGV